MRFLETEIPGAFLVCPDPVEDERGFFARSYCEEEFASHGLPTRFVQQSISYNRRAGTIRGMHWQVGASAEAKLIRCTAGAIFDVIVDLRSGPGETPRVFTTVLRAADRGALFVPTGCAHGFQTLEDETEIFYQMSAAHDPAAARGFRWDDPDVAIPWPRPPTLLSERDRSLPGLRDVR